MHMAVKLLTGVAATVVLARGATLHRGQAIIAELGSAAATALAAHGVPDGSVTFRSEGNTVSRIARVSGTADAATRAAVIAQIRRHPGIQSAVWVPR
jgi:hypothetical protein